MQFSSSVCLHIQEGSVLETCFSWTQAALSRVTLCGSLRQELWFGDPSPHWTNAQQWRFFFHVFHPQNQLLRLSTNERLCHLDGLCMGGQEMADAQAQTWDDASILPVHESLQMVHSHLCPFP